MAPVPAIGDDTGGSVGVYLKRLMARRGANEQTRLLYVAATRARKMLYLSAAPKAKADGAIQPKAGTLLACLWPALGASFKVGDSQTASSDQPGGPMGQPGAPIGQPGGPMGQPGGPMGQPGGPMGQPTPIQRLRSDWSPPALARATPDVSHLPIGHQSLEPPEFSWVGETSRHIGTVVHAGLESFASASALPSRAQIQADRDTYRHQLLRHGVPERDLARATDLVVEALTRTVEDRRGRWIFAPEHREAHSELALTGLAAGRLTGVVIDRSFVDGEGTRWVIDFKTSRHEGGGLEVFLEQEMNRYRPQLETYVALARGLGPNPVRAGLYFPLLGAFRELV
jgi:ATP-dependent exoDNAse (exonuclease V) beta subunit